MKYVKAIGLFVLYPLITFAIGIFVGVKTTHFFYPGEQKKTEQVIPVPESTIEIEDYSVVQEAEAENAQKTLLGAAIGINDSSAANSTASSVAEVTSSMETLSVDTQYVLEETDIVSGSVVETVWKLPDKYVGLNREQFLEAMEAYESFPPLSEMERGFVNLEVLSFSREKVVVQMNYQYIQPSSSFYLAVRDNEVVVYLEDMETVYINTGIAPDSLPEDMQMELMQMIWIENEESLYHFLENYSS